MSSLIAEIDSRLEVLEAELAEMTPQALRSQPGLRAGEIARILGAGQPAISAHLYRGKGTRFACRGGRWFVEDE